jgi:hypothetical protein
MERVSKRDTRGEFEDPGVTVEIESAFVIACGK